MAAEALSYSLVDDARSYGSQAIGDFDTPVAPIVELAAFGFALVSPLRSIRDTPPVTTTRDVTPRTV